MYIYTVIFHQHDRERGETEITVLGTFTDTNAAKAFLNEAATTEARVTERTHDRMRPTLAGRSIKETFKAKNSDRDDDFYLEVKTSRAVVSVTTENPYSS